MWSIVVGVWIAALLIAAVVGGFVGYELSWKLARLRRDGEKLAARRSELDSVAAQLATAQDLLARAQAVRRASSGTRLEKRARAVAPLATRIG